jgi:amino acid adenylation domain-containing protein
MSSDSLSEAKRRLIEQRLRGLPSEQVEAPTIPRLPADHQAPLSPAQHGIWLLHRVDPASAAYNLGAAYWVEGALDLEILERSLDYVAHRHEILLTTFETGTSGIVQVFHPEVRLAVERIGCDGNRVVERARELVRRPFDLEKGPLLRMTLIEGTDDRQLLLLSSHHVILDEWSLKHLWRELSITYSAFVAGGPPDLEAIPIQFADYAAWQEKRLENGLADRQLEFWRRRLAEPLPAAAMPTDRARSARHSDRGAYRSKSIDSRTVGKLRALARSEDASLSMVLLLALNLLVQRYTDTDDVLLGTPIADRQLPETSALLGYFLNTVVLRTDLSGKPTVREALRRVRRTMLEVFEQRDIPFDRVVRELNPPRPTLLHPYFQTMFVFQRQEDAPEALTVPGANLRPLSVDAASAKFDLTLFAQERDGEVATILEYRQDLFEEETIDQLLGHYQVLLESMVADPERPVTQLDILTVQEHRLVTSGWQGQELSLENEPLVHELIAAQAVEKPESTAVITADGQTVPYSELFDLAAALADGLRAAGIETGDSVALQTGRSAESIAGILGIFQTGAAYLPVDPSYPAERRRFMLQDAGVRVVVTEETDLAELTATGIEQVPLTRRGKTTSSRAREEVGIGPEDLAYLIYTSGSTGIPKGVQVSHGNLRASNTARLAYYAEQPTRYLLIPSLSFDSSVAGIFWTLSTGGTLVLPGEKEVRSAEALVAAIEGHRVTHLLCIPSLYRSLLETGDSTRLSSLQSVIVAGETCPADLVARHQQLLPEIALFNEYGPTEATVWATVHRCREVDSRGTVPIGRPIANAKVYLLDEHQRFVPPLVVGQLYIGGPSVAQGYLDRPDLTEQRFVELRLPRIETSERLYATGDLGRWRANGVLEFLGRRDQQVKLSGFRIELAEVEAALRSHPGVEEATVLVSSVEPATSGHRHLVGYYVLEGAQSTPTSTADLRRHLARNLPVHMLPARLVELKTLPRQPNGKLDRQALAELTPEQSQPSTAGSESPSNRYEIQLMRIWLELLDDPSIDRQSNFFEHGGHSLLIPALIERVHQDFAVELPLGAIFEAPTIAELAAVIERDEGQSSWRSLVSIRRGGARPPIFVIHGLAGEISYFYNLARYLPRDRPIYGIQAPAEPYDEMVPMAEAYLQEILQARPEGPYLLVGYCLGGCIAYEMARQLLERGEQVSLLALINSVPPRHLLDESAPLATILARRLKRFTAKGPRQMLASLTSADAVKRHLKSGVRGDKESTEETLDDLLERMHPAYQEATVRHYRALRDYQPKPYPGDAWLFRGSDLYLGADFAWRQIIQGRLDVESIDGHHQYVLKEPNVQGAAEKLCRILEGLDD